MNRMDNARPHDSRKNEAALTVTKALRIPVPAYSPNLSSNDFSFFEMLKKRVLETSYGSSDELISTMRELVASLPKDQPVSIYKNWMKRLSRVINHRGKD
jgi:hypothetical protein